MTAVGIVFQGIVVDGFVNNIEHTDFTTHIEIWDGDRVPIGMIIDRPTQRKDSK